MMGWKERDQTGAVSYWLRQLIPNDRALVRVDCVLPYLGGMRDEVADCYCLDDGDPDGGGGPPDARRWVFMPSLCQV